MNGVSVKYLLVGEAPSSDLAKKNLDVTLACKAVRRRPVAGTMPWLKEHHPRLFDFTMNTLHVNLLDYWPGRDEKKGFNFPMDEGRDAAARLCRELRSPSRTSVEGVKFCQFGGRMFRPPEMVLLAGRRVGRAFCAHSVDYFRVRLDDKVGSVPWVLVPHPSGINHWWNDDANRLGAEMFLRSLGDLK